MSSGRRFGPLEIGETIAGARLAHVGMDEAVALLTFELGDGASVVFALAAAAGRRGPFSSCPELTYRPTQLAFGRFEALGEALGERIAREIGERTLADAVDGWIREARERAWDAGEATASMGAVGGDWREALEAAVDAPTETVRLAGRLPEEVIEARPCVLPWTRLELGMLERFGPCCSDFQAAPATGWEAPLALWRSKPMRAFREAMSAGGHPSTCGRSCPRLAGRSDGLEQLVLRGGPRAFVDNQRRVVEAILAGDSTPEATPLEVCFPVTSFCNYDCLMCRFGEEGTLDDELPEAFYDSLAPLLPGLGRLEVLGGEPLASPVFRGVLASDRFAAYPQLRVSLTTNGSYLGAAELERWAGVRFGHLTISLNAASEATYAAVNRGLPFARIRRNLDAILERRDRAGSPSALTYSMVLLKANLHEVETFAELARRDGAGVRFMLPMFDRNAQSILTDAGAMRAAEEQLRRVARALFAEGRAGDAQRARGEAEVLKERLARGILAPLPDEGGFVTLRSAERA